jgi:isoquinoline 1-oxidoreductase subunit beta
MNARAAELMGQEGDHVEEVRGDPRPILAEAEKVITGDYHRPYEAHATMCPPSAVAHVTDDRVRCLVLFPERRRHAAAGGRSVGATPARSSITQTYQGGGFGGGFTTDVTRQAVEISKQVGTPGQGGLVARGGHPAEPLAPADVGPFHATLGDDGLPTAMIAAYGG